MNHLLPLLMTPHDDVGPPSQVATSPLQEGPYTLLPTQISIAASVSHRLTLGHRLNHLARGGIPVPRSPVSLTPFLHPAPQISAPTFTRIKLSFRPSSPRRYLGKWCRLATRTIQCNAVPAVTCMGIHLTSLSPYPPHHFLRNPRDHDIRNNLGAPSIMIREGPLSTSQLEFTRARDGVKKEKKTKNQKPETKTLPIRQAHAHAHEFD